jgi:hypothetical protein
MPNGAYQRPYKRINLGVIPMSHLMCKIALAALLVALPGCSSTIKYVRELPPADLLADCTETVSEIKTNGQLASAYLAAKGDLAKCNIDKRSLREWAKQ